MPVIVCFAGHLGADPKVAHTTNLGLVVTEAVVYVNRRVKTHDEWHDAEPTRYTIKAWRSRGEQLGQLATGAGVVVIGHVETESWVDKETNEKRYRDVVVIDELGLLPQPVSGDPDDNNKDEDSE